MAQKVEDTSGFHVYAVDPPYRAWTLRNQLAKRVVELTGQLAAGYAKDWADYKARCAEISGLNHAISLCDDMERDEAKERRASINAS